MRTALVTVAMVVSAGTTTALAGPVPVKHQIYSVATDEPSASPIETAAPTPTTTPVVPIGDA